jgi:hypothetical protein
MWRLSVEGITEAERICSQEARVANPDDIEVNIAAQPGPLSSNITLRNFAPFTEDHLRAMGGLIQAWNELEATVEEGIWGLGNFPKEQGRLVTFDMFIARRLEILLRLAHYKFHDGQRRAEIDEIRKKIDKLKDSRNEIIHATWENSQTPGSALAVKYVSYKANQRDIKTHKTNYTAQEIEEIGSKIADATRRLRTFLIDHGVVPLP